jgi:hypothetical protein
MKDLDENNDEELNNDDDSNNDSDNDFSLPSFIIDAVKNIEQQIGSGFHFQSVNVRLVGEDDLDSLPNEVLKQILDKAVEDENYELAVKIRDVINTKK